MWRRVGEIFLKIYLVIALIVDAIVSLAIADNMYSDVPEFILWIVCFLIGAIGILLSALILGLIIEMDKHLEMIEKNSYAIQSLLKGSANGATPASAQNNKLDLSVVAASSSSGWRCRKCDTHNVAGALFCKGCGEKK